MSNSITNKTKLFLEKDCPWVDKLVQSQFKKA